MSCTASYTLSLHDALPILHGGGSNHRLNLRRVFGKGNLPGETDADASRVFPPLPDVDFLVASPFARGSMGYHGIAEDRKSTRLNSSHGYISYAVFCLKKKI